MDDNTRNSLSQMLEELYEDSKLSKEDYVKLKESGGKDKELSNRKTKLKCIRAAKYDFDRDCKFQSCNSGGYKEYKTVGVTQEGDIIIRYIGGIPWM